MAFSRMIWKISPPTPIIGSWDYWTSVQKTIVEIRRRDDDEVVDTIYKVNKKIAYYAMVNCEDSYTLIIISPIDDAVDYTELGVSKTYRGTVTDANGITWYWGGFQFLENRSDYYVYPNCVMGDTVYSVNDGAQAAQDLIDEIYAIPLKQDYGQTTYVIDFSDTANVERAIRKAIGISLFLNFDSVGIDAPYAQFSDNADFMISRILNIIRDKKFVQISSITYTDRTVTVSFHYNYDNSDLTDSKLIRMEEFYNDYGLKGIIGRTTSLSVYLSCYRNAYVRIDDAGVYSQSVGSRGNVTEFRFGIIATHTSQSTHENTSISTSNLCIDL